MITFIRPTVPRPEEWLPFLEASYEAHYFSNGGPCIRQLEQDLAARFAPPDREAILVSSCTAGITAALLSLGVQGPVVVPAFTFPATIQALLAANCTPVFCDVSPATWELDPRSLETVLRTHLAKAILHVRTFGFCQDLDPIEAIAATHNLPLVIDAAAALGGRLPTGQYAGGQGALEVFSLHATKVFGIGEGGVVFAPRGIVADRIRCTINFGLQDGMVAGPGLNGKLSEFAAAVGLAVLGKIDNFIAHRTSIVNHYRSQLGARVFDGLPGKVGAPPWQTFPILLDRRQTGLSTAQVVANCRAQGVEIRRYYHPALHSQGYFFEHTSLPCTETLSENMVCLPVYSNMTTEENDTVIRVFRESLGGC